MQPKGVGMYLNIQLNIKRDILVFLKHENLFKLHFATSSDKIIYNHLIDNIANFIQ